MNRSFAPLLRCHPDLDEVIEFDRGRLGRLGRSAAASAAFLRFARDLRRRRFDLAIDLQGLFRSGVFTWVTRAAVRVGFADARELAWVFYTHRIPPADGDLHAVDRNYAVSALFGFHQVPKVSDLALTDDERCAARRLLSEAGLSTEESFVAILPGARGETKRWLPDRFADVVGRLADRGLRSVLMGGPGERELCGQIASSCRSAPANLAGLTGLRELAALIEQACAVLCHDSGPMHIAAVLGRPMVSIVGPTNPRRTGPYERLDTVMRLELPCSPCYFRRLAQCTQGHECMRGISAADVADRLVDLLEPAAVNADS